MIHFQALLCVIGIAAGQVLFKLAASSLSRTGSVLAPETALLMVIALGVYGFVTLAWIWILRKADLGKVYPLTALAFVLVPLASHWMFGEQFHLQYFIGVALIMSGIVLAVRS